MMIKAKRQQRRLAASMLDAADALTKRLTTEPELDPRECKHLAVAAAVLTDKARSLESQNCGEIGPQAVTVDAEIMRWSKGDFAERFYPQRMREFMRRATTPDE